MFSRVIYNDVFLCVGHTVWSHGRQVKMRHMKVFAFLLMISDFKRKKKKNILVHHHFVVKHSIQG